MHVRGCLSSVCSVHQSGRRALLLRAQFWSHPGPGQVLLLALGTLPQSQLLVCKPGASSASPKAVEGSELMGVKPHMAQGSALD